MNTNLYAQRKNSLVFEAATAKATDEQLAEVNSELALGFSIQELKEIQSYFKKENRNPTDVELQTISQTLRAKSSSTAKKSTAFSKPT
jgi:phosphoribosylformylglycinamidine synthase